MGHAHHTHSPHHHGPRGRARSRLLATIFVSGSLMVAEVIGGLMSGSLALLADAGHMLTDVLALLVAFAALTLSELPADHRRTYGYRRLEILAALINGVALVVLSVGIASEAVERWLDPQPIQTGIMAIVATVGLLANLVGLWLLGHDRDNLNVRGAFLHVLGDTLSSVGVLVGAGIIALTGWLQVDAIISICIAAIIVFTSVKLLREVVDVLLEAAPPHIDTQRIRESMAAIEGVEQVHDLHVWSITSGMPALSAHLVVRDVDHDHATILQAAQGKLREEFDISHATLQIEPRDINCGCC